MLQERFREESSTISVKSLNGVTAHEKHFCGCASSHQCRVCGIGGRVDLPEVSAYGKERGAPANGDLPRKGRTPLDADG